MDNMYNVGVGQNANNVLFKAPLEMLLASLLDHTY